MLDKIARAGSIAGPAYGMHVPERMEGPLQELLVRGYVTLMKLLGRSDHRHYTLSEKGRSCVKHCVELTSPTPFLSFKREVEEQPSDSREELTTLELIGLLTQQGWKDEVRQARQRLQPFTAEADLIWYRTELQKPSKLYLRVLLTALDRFGKKTLSRVCHFQSQNYYKAILEGYDPLPNQPLDYYKLVMKGPVAKNTRASKLKPNRGDDIIREDQPLEIEDTGSLDTSSARLSCV